MNWKVFHSKFIWDITKVGQSKKLWCFNKKWFFKSSYKSRGVSSFEKIDNYQHGIHDYFKYLKFGFGRATDQLSYLVRRGKISRSKAINEAKKYEGKFPQSYLGKSLDQILNKINLNINEFTIICDKFTNKKIFKCDSSGRLIKDKDGNLQKEKYDN